jgi:hypothetical protein
MPRSLSSLSIPQPGKVSLFHGRNPTNWASGLTTYERLRYTNLYPGIDLVGISPLFERERCRPALGALGYDYAEGGGVPGALHFRTRARPDGAHPLRACRGLPG